MACNLTKVDVETENGERLHLVGDLVRLTDNMGSKYIIMLEDLRYLIAEMEAQLEGVVQTHT